MKRFLLRVDSLVIGAVEWASHGLQLLTGYDCFHQRDCLWVVAAACYLWQGVVFLGLPGWQRFLVVPMVLLVLFYLWMSSALLESKRYLDNVYREGNLSNYKKLDEDLSLMRGLYPLVLALMSVSRGLTFVAGVVIYVALCLDACNPLPPGAGKISQWLKRLSLSLQPSAQPSTPHNAFAAQRP